MASLISKIKNFFSRISFGKLVCVLFTLAMVLAVSACDGPETNPDQKVEIDPNQVENCLTCPVFELVYTTGETLSKDFHQKISPDALKLLGVGFALWLAIYVLKFVSSFKEPDIAGFWNGLGIRTFWVALMAGFLSSGLTEVMEMLLEPIFGGFLELSMTVVAGLPAGSEGTISCASSDPKSGLVCLITAASLRFQKGPEIAVQMLPYLFVNPLLVLGGCISIFFSYLLIIVTPLYLVEAVFCYFIVVALLPLWVTAFAFPITRGYTKTAWDFVLGIFIQILGLCMFLGLAAQIFSIMMKEAYSGKSYGADILTAVSAPMTLILVSYFIYLFGGVLLQVVNAVFSTGVSGGVVSSIKDKAVSKVQGLAKKGVDNLDRDTFGSTTDEAAKQSGNDKRMSDAERRNESQSRYGQAQARLRGEAPTQTPSSAKSEETASAPETAPSADATETQPEA